MNSAPKTASPAEFLVARGISKRFGITQALDDVTVSFQSGEVHALMGENGAGKSTLGKVIAGLYAPDAGSVVLVEENGVPRSLKAGSIESAFDAGVRLVHQELAQCPHLSVAENLCLHDLPTNRFGLIDKREMNARAARLLAELEPGIRPQSMLGSLSPGHRQIVQIAGALEDRGTSDASSSRPRVIVLDEPTSSLAIAEVERLLAIVRKLASSGITVIYVSHRMGEIFAACDRVTVLRDGKYVATSNVKDIDEPTLVEQMIGRTLTHQKKRAATPESLHSSASGVRAGAPVTEPLLRVENLSSPGVLDSISLHVAPGEVLGIGGLVGSGRSELLDAIFGVDQAAIGSVMVSGKHVPRGSPQASIGAGVGYVPEDRKLQGLFFQLGLSENIVAPVMSRLGRFGFRSARSEKSHVRERMGMFQIKAASPRSLPGELSGGNQQKLLVARWMGQETRVLLLDEPTRGIDIGTKTELYRLIISAAEQGAAVVLVSSEMPELLALSDRIVVLSSGRLTGELRGEEMTQTNILRLATREARVKV